MGKNTLRQAAMVALADTIRGVCKPTEGGCMYIEGWSDSRIVEESAGRITIHNVVGLRQELLGKLVPPKNVDPLQNALDRLAVLEKIVEVRFSIIETWASLRPVAPFLPLLMSTGNTVSELQEISKKIAAVKL